MACTRSGARLPPARTLAPTRPRSRATFPRRRPSRPRNRGPWRFAYLMTLLPSSSDASISSRYIESNQFTQRESTPTSLSFCSIHHGLLNNLSVYNVRSPTSTAMASPGDTSPTFAILTTSVISSLSEYYWVSLASTLATLLSTLCSESVRLPSFTVQLRRGTPIA